ncbi:MAG: SDR family oxidoreductase, partial [Phycisphaerae bacterium]|nr:SDR family oxidoreductase [Phycisphaerae bacterium]
MAGGGVTSRAGLAFPVRAGGWLGQHRLKELTVAELDRGFVVTTRAALLLVQVSGAQHGDARPGGRVVWFTSGQHHGGMPAELPSIVSRAVLHEGTSSLAVYLIGRGIAVNGVDPGPDDTGSADGATCVAVAAVTPGRRWSTLADIVRLVAWLLGDEAGWATGQIIASDGGWSARWPRPNHPGVGRPHHPTVVHRFIHRVVHRCCWWRSRAA